MTHRLHKGKPKRGDISTKAVLLAVKHAKSTNFAIDAASILVEAFGCAVKVAYGAIEREVHRDYLDYGTTMRLPWLTPAGEVKLYELQHQEEPAHA